MLGRSAYVLQRGLRGLQLEVRAIRRMIKETFEVTTKCGDRKKRVRSEAREEWMDGKRVVGSHMRGFRRSRTRDLGIATALL